MSEAPERIWADGDAEWDSGSWGLNKEFDNNVEYVRADRIEELKAKLVEYKMVAGAIDKQWAESEDEVAELKAELHKYDVLIRELFRLLDITEETDEGRVFRPNKISSCRAMDAEKLNQVLKELKNVLEDRG